jgi:flagellar secretion chaperone FliS
MGNAANAYGAYRSAEVNTVSQKDLIVRLYEGSERFLNSACLAMDSKDFVKSMNECRRARDIFIELLATLNFEKGGEFALRLKDLYSFFILQISEGSLRKNPEQIRKIMPLIKTLREGWENVPDEEANTSSIPAGNDGHAFNLRC